MVLVWQECEGGEETAEEILLGLFGPREWEHQGENWLRVVSTDPRCVLCR